MPNDMSLRLENDTHIKPLLKYYLGEYDPQIAAKAAIDEEDWDCIVAADGSATCFRLDVVAGGRAGAKNIRDGYLRTLAQCLKKGLNPPAINVVSIINHHQVHWTSSVTTIQIEEGFIESLKSELYDVDLSQMSVQEIINKLNEIFYPELYAQHHLDKARAMVEDRLKLFGAQKVSVKHYDSHNPDPSTYKGSYYKDYKKATRALIVENEPKVTIEAASAKRQKGDTCGDNALYNGFIGGVLKLSPSDKANQMGSSKLRAATEFQVPALKPTALASDEEKVAIFTSKLLHHISEAKEKQAKPKQTLTQTKVKTPTAPATRSAIIGTQRHQQESNKLTPDNWSHVAKHLKHKIESVDILKEYKSAHEKKYFNIFKHTKEGTIHKIQGEISSKIDALDKIKDPDRLLKAVSELQAVIQEHKKGLSQKRSSLLPVLTKLENTLQREEMRITELKAKRLSPKR